MQNTIESKKLDLGSIGGTIKVAKAQNGGTKGNSKPGNGGTHAGPPPPPQPRPKA